MLASDLNINLNIDPNVKSIGVLFSGGIDSTFLLALLQLERKQRSFSLKAYNIDNNVGYQFHCEAILKNPFFNEIEFVKEIPNGGDYSGIIREGITWVLKQNELDLVFIGINKNPDFEHSGKPVRRTIEELAPIKKLRYPFIHLTKDKIINAFLKIEDRYQLSLLKDTHSCTSLKLGQCGHCFQCTERRWAFESLHRNDPALSRSL